MEVVILSVWANQYIDPGLLSTPVLAVEQARWEILRMAKVIRGM